MEYLKEKESTLNQNECKVGIGNHYRCSQLCSSNFSYNVKCYGIAEIKRV